MPYAFTEQGIYMLATVLRGELAEIVLDYGLPTEQVYHCGASSKDACKKLCAINKIENIQMIHSVIDILLLGADKVIA